MKVSRLPVDTGSSGWNEILPQADPSVRLEADLNSDFLIIGAGFAGLSAARRLSQLKPDARIVVLDAKRIGEGPAGRNSGFMIDLPHELGSANYSTTLENDRRQIKLNRHAIEFAADAAREFQLDAEAFNPSGKINGAASRRALEHNLTYAKHLEALGEPHQLLGADEMRKLTGSSFYKSGVKTPNTVLIQPALYVRGFAKGLGNRVSIFEESPVVGMSRQNGFWIAETSKGTVRAQKVILATNGHIESFGFFKRQVFHIILYASMTRALTQQEAAATGEPQWGITPSDPSATTMRKVSGTGGTRIVTRNQSTYAPDLEVPDHLLVEMGERHKKSFAKRYPELDHVDQEFCWAGRLCLSRNSVPAFGELEEGLYSACCQNGLGTTKGTLAGIAAAELATEGKTPLAAALLEEGKPKKLPPAPLDSIGAKAFMRWGEFKAREEL